MLRYLRIAVSVVCLTACVLLIALWVRSYRTSDRLHGLLRKQEIVLASKQGRLTIILIQWDVTVFGWQVITHPVNDELSFPTGPMQSYESAFGFGWINDPILCVQRSTQSAPPGVKAKFWGTGTTTIKGAGPIMPYWFLVLLTGSIAAALTIRRPYQFSLRTLLIAMTLVAVVLGIIAISN